MNCHTATLLWQPPQLTSACTFKCVFLYWPNRNAETLHKLLTPGKLLSQSVFCFFSLLYCVDVGRLDGRELKDFPTERYLSRHLKSIASPCNDLSVLWCSVFDHRSYSIFQYLSKLGMGQLFHHVLWQIWQISEPTCLCHGWMSQTGRWTGWLCRLSWDASNIQQIEMSTCGSSNVKEKCLS